MRLPKCKRIDIDADPEPWLRHGWREIEQLVTYERPPAIDGFVEGVRLQEHWEQPVIRAIAGVSFSEDRLHRDPKVLDDDADKFKVQCVEEAHQKRWPVLTVGQPMTLGFLIMRPEKDANVIDLLAVLPDARGHGIGASLVSSFLYVSGFWLDFGRCRAGTQAHNVAACRIYKRLGFYEAKRERTFHL